MYVLRIRDDKGNYIPIPAIQGEPGKDYILTDADKQEIRDAVLVEMPEIGLPDSDNSTPIVLSNMDGNADIFPIKVANSLCLYDSNNKIPTGVEVVKIEGSWDGETWFDFKRLIETNPTAPYFIANTHSFYDESNGMNCILVVGYIADQPAWVSRVENYELNKVRVTYKNDIE